MAQGKRKRSTTTPERRMAGAKQAGRTGNNDQLKPDIQVTLTGDERYFIQHAIERTAFGQRTGTEKRLMEKVQ